MALTVQLLQMADLELTRQFAIYTRQLLFPEVYQAALPYDLSHFDQVYLHHAEGACFIIKQQDEIMGMIAYRAYQPRFELDLPKHCVEVVKLFVQPEYRRLGLATRLCNALFEHARQKNITHFYLHTHPFLPAAEIFWQQQGFKVIKREQIQQYPTIHMLKSV